MNNIVITESLQNTVRTHPLIKKVYFDENGKHYFQVFELPVSKEKDAERALFGTGVFSHRQVIPGMFNVEKRTEEISKGDPTTLIVESLTREDILNATAKKEGEAIAAQIVNATAEDKNIIMAALFDADTLAALSAIKSGKVKLVPVEDDAIEGSLPKKSEPKKG